MAIAKTKSLIGDTDGPARKTKRKNTPAVKADFQAFLPLPLPPLYENDIDKALEDVSADFEAYLSVIVPEYKITISFIPSNDTFVATSYCSDANHRDAGYGTNGYGATPTHALASVLLKTIHAKEVYGGLLGWYEDLEQKGSNRRPAMS